MSHSGQFSAPSRQFLGHFRRFYVQKMPVSRAKRDVLLQDGQRIYYAMQVPKRLYDHYRGVKVLR